MRNHESPSSKPACTCGRRACSYYGNAINASCFALLLFSDSLTKIFGSATNNAIAFVSSSTEYMRLLATGQFLIGSSVINQTIGTSTLSIVGTTTNGTANVFSVASSSGASLFLIKNNGFVGIGTTTPTSALSVNGGIDADNIVLNNSGGLIFGNATDYITGSSTAHFINFNTNFFLLRGSFR